MIEFFEGKAEFNPSHLNDYIFILSTNLAKIHSVECSKLDLSFLPKEIYAEMLDKSIVNIDDSLNEGVILDSLKSVWPLPPRNKDLILHGDFWTGNILWKDCKLIAVIDWEDSALGDPLADVANSRLEILWAFGIDAMKEFTNINR
jgi:thiamine kinase-like enzyme